MTAGDGGDAVRAGHGPLGILAGAGALPIEIAASVNVRGRAVHLVAIAGFAENEIADFPHEWVTLGQIGGMLASFRRAGCREIVIAGGLRRPDILRTRPDLGALRHMPTILSLTRGGDDSLLRRVVRFFEGQGFIVRGAGEMAPELLAAGGPAGRRTPTDAELHSVAKAARAIRALGRFDVGQAAVATTDGVVAIETARGTDALLAVLAAGGAASGSGRGGVLVKLAKPGQELRVDLPAIGPRTIDGAVKAGLAGIAVEAGRTIVLERGATRTAADEAGIFLYGLEEAVSSDLPPLADLAAMRPLSVLARRAPTPRERRDNAIGRQLLDVMRREDLGRAAVIAGEHVLAVSGQLDVATMLRTLGRDAQWGRRWFRRRIGSLALRLDGGEDSVLTLETFQAAADARLAGIVCDGGTIPSARLAEVAGWANDARMFLMAEVADDA